MEQANPNSSATIAEEDGPIMPPAPARRDSSSQRSDNSQTAAEFLREQMQLEADAREALPYSIENCTKPLGPLRQSVFACLTCNPVPEKSAEPYNAAGVCYACSVSCHGEHTLVEIFTKRNFTCDCGTTRLPATSPCSLRINAETNTKGDVRSESPDVNNKYNQNFRNRFCGCECDYDPFQQKGTMFQCLGLGTHEIGACGEDWWHPGCVVGLGPNWFEHTAKSKSDDTKVANGNAAAPSADATLPTISEDDSVPPNSVVNGNTAEEDDDDDDPPMPPGFPGEDDFETFLCYKCVEAHPWIKRYAGTPGFLPAVFLKENAVTAANQTEEVSKKRKADDGEDTASQSSKRVKSDAEIALDTAHDLKPTETKEEPQSSEPTTCKLKSLPPAPQGQFSLFMKDSFRDNFCRCPDCFKHLAPHPQLLEEEETYEPPVSENGSEDDGSTHGSGSLYDRGESALRNVDRVRAIEGVMAYNHMKEKLKPFFQEFAESGKAISAEDIKAYFAKLRGDEQGIKESNETANDFREEQSGY